MMQPPADAEGWFRQGVAHLDAYQRESARRCFEQALALEPRHAKASNNLGTVLQWEGRDDEAQACYRRALEANPELAQAWFNLGDLARERGGAEDAAVHYRRAIGLDAAQAEWHAALAWALGQAGRPQQALLAMREAVRLDPDAAALYEQLGNCLLDAGDAQAALEAYRRAIEIDPALRTARSRVLCTLNLVAEETPETIYLAHAAWAREHALPALRTHGNNTSPDRKLRIGYLAPDFADPALSCLVEPVLASHDRAAFEILCYSDAETETPATWRLRPAAALWHATAHVDNWHLPVRIREDRIDILVDLGGHAAGGNRMPMISNRPAPVQLSWPSYPCTTGLEVVDGRICDWQSSPDGDARFYAERLVRLPGRQWCFRPQADAQPAAAIASAQRGGATFGAFHGMARVSPESVAAWAGVLRAMPGSRLVLRARGARDLAGTLAERFAREGIDAARIECEEPLPLEAHLAAHDRIDVWLDALPWSNVAGTFYALWMGVPVVTLRGATTAGKGAAEVLGELGLEAWVAGNAVEFARIAAVLAADAAQRTRLRSELRPRLERSVWMDVAGYTRGLEGAYREQWRTWCAGQARRTVEEPVAQPRGTEPGTLTVAVDGVCFQEGPPRVRRLWLNLFREWEASGFARNVVLLDRDGSAPALPGLRRRRIGAHRSDRADEDRLLVQQACDAEGAQVFMSTGFSTPLATPLVMMVADMIPEMLGFDIDRPEWLEKRACIERAQRYVALSRHSGHDLRRMHPTLEAARITVAYPGAGDVFRLASDAELAQFRARHGITRPYFLSVGEREGKDRNGRALFRALARLEGRSRLGVLCAGGEAQLPPEAVRDCADAELRRLDLDDAELRFAYAGAIALVHVPLHEGFPLPVVEAMRCGCPVIASSHASLPEIAGEAAVYVNPVDAAGLALALERIRQPELRAPLIARGMERARQYTWARMAREVAGAIAEAAETAKEKDPVGAIRAS